MWPRGLGLESGAVRLLELWIRIPPGTWESSYECCRIDVSATGLSLFRRILSERGVPECDLETSIVRWPKTTRLGLSSR